MARWCARDGAAVRVWDSRAQPPQAGALARARARARCARGRAGAPPSPASTWVSRARAWRRSDAHIAASLVAARRRQPVHGELDLFADALADLHAELDYAPKVIAVTGTNGKTTTTAMTAQLVERSGQRAPVAGNIGPTMLQTLADARPGRPAPRRCASACPRSGCSSSRASSSPPPGPSSRRRGHPQRHRGPPRLARLDAPLRRREGEGLREHAVWSSTATTRRRALVPRPKTMPG